MAIYLTPDRTYKANGVTVKEYLLTKHNIKNISLPSKRIGNCEGVTIHNTGWINVNSATTPAEQYTRATVNGNMNTVRVTYYVDDVCAWQNLPNDYQSWHAGQSGKADANGSEVGNKKTISIECIMGGTTGYEKSEDNCARLAAYLLYINGLSIDKLYTHNYWCNVRNGKKGDVDYLNKLNDGYKGCPIYIRPHWDKFKSTVLKYLNDLNGKNGNNSSTSTTLNNTSTFTDYKVKIKDTSLNVRKDAGITNPIVCVIKKNEVYTIVDEKKVGTATWGKLKSGVGWINVGTNYVTKL